MTNCGVYLVRNKLNGKLYVGSSHKLANRWRNHRTGHGSAIYLTRAVKKYGSDNFEFSILEECQRADLPRVEGEWIKILGTVAPDGYNLSSFTGNGGQVRHPDSIARQSAKLKGRVMSAEWREKLAAAKRGRKITPEHAAKLHAGRRGQRLTQQEIDALTAARVGCFTAEVREKMRRAHLGYQPSQTHREKLSAATKRQWQTARASGRAKL